MQYIATKKVPGGKLLRVKIPTQDDAPSLPSAHDTQITSIQITGDFFLHPEDVLEDIEKALTGLVYSQDVNIYANAVQQILDDRHATLIGVSAQDIAQTICDAFLSPSSPPLAPSS